MRRPSTRFTLSLVALTLIVPSTLFLIAADNEPPKPAALRKLMQQGNFKEALNGLKVLCLDQNTADATSADAFRDAVQCMSRLGLLKEFDALAEGTVKAHAEHWRTLERVAQQHLSVPHHGFMISGNFERGSRRGGAKMVHATERDRVRAMQLLQQAMPLVLQDDNKNDVSRYFLNLSDALLNNRGFQEAWRLQVLTDISQLPDYEDGYRNYRPYNGAPVDAEGQPVFYHEPANWKASKTDGERRRWALAQAVENMPARRAEVLEKRAQFLRQQFGVETMAQNQFPWRGMGSMGNDDDENESGTYALHTLKETETIAKLATGIKRFDLPAEFNHIKLLQEVAKLRRNAATGPNSQLAGIFENRRQYPRAAEYWRKVNPNEATNRQLQQIIGNWGMFESTMNQPKGKGATIEYRFRNGKAVSFEAHAIKMEKLLADAKAHLKSNPRRVDHRQINISNIGYRLVHENQQAYLGDRVATWNLALKPRASHFDKRITVNTPLQDPGAYLLTAKMRDGNVNKVIIWISDAAIVKKTLAGKQLYYVADSVTGKPLPNINVEFFGYQQKNAGGNRYQTITTNFAERTNANGIVTPDPRDQQPNMQYLVTARVDGRMVGHLGFRHVWHGRLHDAEYNQVKFFAITDRPVYRPGHQVKFKFWARQAQYDMGAVSKFANVSFPVEVYNPKGDKLLQTTLKADEYGGLDGIFDLPSDSMLGAYRIHVKTRHNNRQYGGNTSFRVEEYKKPEYQVTIDAPSEPVALGEKITAKIQAKYYFGSPVTNATVKYKITRSEHSQDWYPIAPWDWCYGPGYWWFCYDTPWYPGWNNWVGCMRPVPTWWHGGPRNPPELVAEQEVAIGPDGTVEVEIDTAIAKELHGDLDHKYSITAEVRDESRRTIVGSGNVLVARKPFKVFSWLDRGHYRVGDVIGANFKAQTLDNKPVQGAGKLTLLKITYDKNQQPIETPVQTWALDTNEEGVAQQQLRARAPGQYRISYQLTDSAEHEIEGGYLFTVIGTGFDGADYKFNHLELIPEKQTYNPGETVRLQINTDRVGSTVLLFVRPTNGVYLPPKTIRLKGKSVVEEITVVKKDMPNFFVEAITVADGRVYQEAKEIVVPPEKRILNVAVDPSATEYLPGEKARVKVHLTDHTGENFVGSTVVAIYDKSLEYISGGSNVGDIKEFFWKWRRHHQPAQETNLQRYFANMNLPNRPGMNFLGVFGRSVVEEAFDKSMQDQQASIRGRAQGLNNSLMRAKSGRYAAAASAPMAAMAESDFAMDAPEGMGGGLMTDEGAVAMGPGSENGQAALEEPTVRSNFADTALWVGALTTDDQGVAEVTLDMPENLSTWKVKVWGMGHGTRVGSGETEVITRKNLILRLQAPRFFVQKDEVVLSANVHNYLAEATEAQVVLELDGTSVTNPDASPLAASESLTQTVNIPAGGEVRVDWRVNVADEGNAIVRMKALTNVESDAMQMSFPCYVHGMLKQEAWAGTVRPDQQSALVTVTVPEQRRAEQTVLEVRYSPSLAGAMVDALPYLADYPYGCTEQTLNRFLPAAITQKTLLKMNLDLAAIHDKRTNLNAQEIGDDQDRAKQWKRFDRNPVFDEVELDRIVREGLKRLTDMQNRDGGWGWFSGTRERSWPHTTCVVLHGLQVAQEIDLPIVPGVVENGVAWLKRYQAAELQKIRNAATKTSPWKPHADHLDAFVYMVLVDGDVDNLEMREQLYKDRNHLAVYAKAMLALACHKQQDANKVAMLKRNIEQFLVEDEENETAYLRLPADQSWWYWWGSETEANAYYLRLLARLKDPTPKAPRLVKYLLNNRKHSTYWRNTRDTATCVESFAEYIQASGEFDPNMTVEVWIDGQKQQEAVINRDNLFTFNNKFILSGEAVTAGSHDVELRRRGKGPVYFNAYLTNFTLEDKITKAGLEVKVERAYYQLKPVKKTIKAETNTGAAVDQRVEKYERIPLKDLSKLKSGDLVEVELSIASKNDYEYLIFEDMKPAGFETVDVRSGYNGNEMGAYVEFRDNRVAFFIRRLARGSHSVSYRMRAEIPGRFSALPTRGYAMYAPELKGNSDEIKLIVED